MYSLLVPWYLLKRELEWRLPSKITDSEPRSSNLAFIPYRAQYLLLTTIQRLLEGCCFDFVVKWLPDLLIKYMWDCSEAVELNRWIRVLLKYSTSLSQHAFDNNSGLTLKTVFLSVNMLRHSAVHRLQMSAARIIEMIQCGARFASVLRDPHRAVQPAELQQEVQVQSNKLEIWKNLLRRRFAGELQDISERRAKLDRMEEQVEVAVIKEDNNNRSLIGVLLEESVTKILRSNEIMGGRPEIQPDLQDIKLRAAREDIGVVRGDMCFTRNIRPGLLALEKPPHGGTLGDGFSDDEFSCDEATYEALRFAAEHEALVDV